MHGTVKAWGTIHVALACAGISSNMMTYSSKGMMDIIGFKKCMDINLFGSLHVAKYGSAIMSKNKSVNDQGEKGVILFVSSVSAEEG